MKIFYSKSASAFFAGDLRASYEAAGNWPVDAVEISLAEHAELLRQQSTNGKEIKADADGFPFSADPTAIPLPDLKILKNDQINQWRAQANSSTFPHAGKVFACDALSRSDIDGVANNIAMFDAFPAGFPGGWKAIDNSILVMPDIEAFKSFYQSMTVQGTANFNHAQELKTALASATTEAAIVAIVW